MNTTIQPAVFQATGAQILKKYPLDIVTLKRFVEEQVWGHPGCMLCSLGSLGGGTTADAKQSSTEASPLESHAAMNICR